MSVCGNIPRFRHFIFLSKEVKEEISTIDNQFITLSINLAIEDYFPGITYSNMHWCNRDATSYRKIQSILADELYRCVTCIVKDYLAIGIDYTDIKIEAIYLVDVVIIEIAIVEGSLYGKRSD
jgi:hypothetical protein